MHDVLIVGGGSGGYVAAIKCAQGGLRTLLIEEREALGGVCLNEGCIPTKAIVHSVQAYREIKNADKLGLKVEGKVTADIKAIIARKRVVVEQLTSGVKHLITANGVEAVRGVARLKSEHEVEVDGKTYQAKQLILATGAVPKKPPIKGIDLPHVMTSTEILEIESLPKDLVVIGAGSIGIEFAAILNELEVNVTVVEAMPNILPYAENELAGFFMKHLEAAGIRFHMDTTVEEIARDKVIVKTANGRAELPCSAVLVAVGRGTNYSIFDDKWKAELVNKNGFVETDNRMQTKIKTIRAIGDINGNYLLAHVATAEGLVAAANLNGKGAQMDYRFVPNCVYCDLELAGVGLTEEEAKSKNIDYHTASFPITSNGKALCDGVAGGMIKIIAGKKFNELLGVHILAPHAAELIAESVMALNMEVTADELVKIIHPHPSMSEIYPEVGFKLLGAGLHS